MTSRGNNDSWIRRNATNLVVGLLSTAIVGVANYVKDLNSQIIELRTLYNVHVAKDEDQNSANKEKFRKIESLAAEHENEIDRNREDMITVKDFIKFYEDNKNKK